MISIKTEKTYSCPRCKSVDLVKNGTNACGHAQFKCKNCGKMGVLEPRFRYSEADKEHILSFINEGMSLRGISRKFHVKSFMGFCLLMVVSHIRKVCN
jgi:transposase-like protein